MFSAERVKQYQSRDTFLQVAIILLAGLGITTLFSASYYYAELKFDDALHFVRRQLMFLGLGTVLAIVMARTPLDMVKRYSVPLILISLALSLATFIPGIGQEIMGARRWIYVFGYSFQPSELAKVAVILYLAYMLSKKEERINDFMNSLFPPLLVVFVFVAIIYLQNDFSTAFFIFFIALAMFFIANIRLIYFFLLLSIGIPLGGILLFTKEHRVQRLIAFLHPESDPIGAGYQINAAKSALVKGGLWGTGVGEGAKKLGGLPEAHSDFVFAVLGEEMGFLGVLFVIAIFGFFAYRGYLIAYHGKDKYVHYLAFGITTCVLYQALLNIAVVSGLIPATGIPLPFFSSGGSSLVMTLIMAGILVNLSKHVYVRRKNGYE
jgi:cell division protein FtsW